ncbi:DNA-binding HxlR family transcriptional regulator [Agromyces terreus]|uniref:DNA-binding HxlR family transcriptional regulator n=1 Tax=Agromyces terreus TaxID=424795 RepID=A0A9X2GZD7_9MICO|nr:helix-turn-helix domain-containing protein [Agromyces terreus]MCP2370276.1 DNA-binding HxlR family transcriptional regulator [Agromyces terreus]
MGSTSGSDRADAAAADAPHDDLAQHRARLHELGRIDEAACRRFQHSVEFAGRKWNAAILLAGVRGARRFSEYRMAVDGISDRLLAARLKELEDEGVIERHVRATTPVTITYTPSASGLRLIEVLQPLVEWGAGHDAARAGIGKEPAAG